MAFQDIETASAQFSEKYGVKFDINAFDAGLKAIGDSKGLGSSRRNNFYKDTFTALYEAAYANYLCGKFETFDFEDMLKDFEGNIMKPYREFCGTDQPTPKEYGSWGSTRVFMKDVRSYLQGVPTSATILAEQRYEKGKMRIRDMRDYATSLNDKTEPTNGEIATLKVYADALKNTNDSRSILWRIVHPIRNAAEKREAKNFQAQVDRLIATSAGDDEQAATDRANAIETLIKSGGGKARAIYDHVKNDIKSKENRGRSTEEKANVIIEDKELTNEIKVQVSEPVIHNPEVEHSAPEYSVK